MELSLIHIDAADEEDSVDLGGRRIIKKSFCFYRSFFCILISGFEPKGSVNSDYNFCSRRFAFSKSLVSLRLLVKSAAGRFYGGRPTRSPMKKISVEIRRFFVLSFRENCLTFGSDYLKYALAFV